MVLLCLLVLRPFNSRMQIGNLRECRGFHLFTLCVFYLNFTEDGQCLTDLLSLSIELDLLEDLLLLS